MDSGTDVFHRELVRLEHDRKYGFADRRGRIVIPVRYDGALNSDEEGPKVCVGCRMEKSGEYGLFTGGHWFSADGRGHLRAVSNPPAR
jgi:hypothetical protein